MNAKFLEAIAAVCRENEIDLHLRDIVEISDYEDEIVMWVRNDKEMFEFTLRACLYPTIVNMSISPVEDSPYSCDVINAEYNLIDRNLTIH